MNLTTKYMTRNDCYTANRKIKPKGIMVHSTAAPGAMAAVWFAKWNKSFKAKETNRQVCVHAFVDDNSIWQYLPWDHRGWHAGGRANDTHIGFEICEPAGHHYVSGSTMIDYDVAKNEAYFHKIWQNAIDLCVMLCKQYGMTEKNIICHSEGHRKGIASNHGDVMHWFPKHRENMDTFRAAVKSALAIGSVDPKPNQPEQSETIYRVRKNWAEASTQKGAFNRLDYAKECADQHAGYSVFDDDGKLVYPVKSISYGTYTVQKGDTLWGIAQEILGSGARYTEIMTLNCLTSKTIHTGQTLKIPK